MVKSNRNKNRPTNRTNKLNLSIQKNQKRKASEELNLPSNKKFQQLKLRPIILDGMNIAITFGKRYNRLVTFDVLGIKKAYDYFTEKGHEVTIVLPQVEKIQSNSNFEKKNMHILDDLRAFPDVIMYAKQRKLGRYGPWISSHDDLLLFSIEETSWPGAIIVSNDHFKPEFDEGNDYTKNVIEKQVISYDFHWQNFMLPEDPLGAIYDKNRMRNPMLHPKKNKNDRNNNKKNNPQKIKLDDFLKF